MAQKIPPPPPFAGPEWQAFNRWLLELTSILSNQGGITPEQVDGLPAVINQVGTNTSDIADLNIRVNDQTGSIGALQLEINTINNDLIVVNGALTSLGARGEVLNGVIDPGPALGKVNDWYANTAGAAGHRIFVKTAVATWTAFPF